jgi:Rha family phage regulatory protein
LSLHWLGRRRSPSAARPGDVAELRQLAAPVVNSRDVAEHFGKRHDNVLRDIEALTTASELRASNWFREVVYLDAKGESRASFDLTRQGFHAVDSVQCGKDGRAATRGSA